jgi:uncharacterized protein (TIGR02147 family)
MKSDSPIEEKKQKSRLAEAWEEQPPSRFLDYRDFLETLRLTVKKYRGQYTYQEFSKELGFKSPNAAYMLAKGRRRFTSKYFETVVKTLKLRGLERKYLSELLTYTDSKDESKKTAAFSEMTRLKELIVKRPEERWALKFYSDWRHAAIYELAEQADFREDPEWIAGQFYQRMTPSQAKESVDLLLSIGFFLRNESGQIEKAQADVETPREVLGLAVAGYHLSMLDLAKASLSQVPSKERSINALTLTVSEDTFSRIREDLDLFRQYLKFLSQQDSQPRGRIIQVNLQAFALTRASDKEDLC